MHPPHPPLGLAGLRLPLVALLSSVAALSVAVVGSWTATAAALACDLVDRGALTAAVCVVFRVEGAMVTMKERESMKIRNRAKISLSMAIVHIM